MRILTTPDEITQFTRQQQARGRRVGLVPTMGALHDGHRALIRAARSQCEAVIVSIFVNPTQFGANEDLSRYPRTPTADHAMCRGEGVAAVFEPSAHAMYPAGFATRVTVDSLSSVLCGVYRPGHFEGVATVVSMLFQMIPADRAFFGEKDFQQLAIIRRMVADLRVPVKIVGVPTVREVGGLAMSSRNAYLSTTERQQALSISKGLFRAREMVEKGERSGSAVTTLVREIIAAGGPCTIEYVEVVHAESLHSIAQIVPPAQLCVAVRVGGTRLIDNLALDIP